MSAALDLFSDRPAAANPIALRSPSTGAALRPDGPHSLAAPGERWPLIDGIAYLRLGHEPLVRAVLAALDAEDPVGATVLLLQDRPAADPDDAVIPSPEALRALVLRHGALGFREAMRGLGLGFSAEYFAHRWSDPTFLSGLALAEAHWPARPRVIEPACGAGHFLRAFARHDATAIGGDLVFAHLWLARHFVAPAATLVCFDAAQPWPFEDGAADMVFCHDALHLFADAGAAVAEMRRVAGDGGSVLCGGVAPSQASHLPGALAYDDGELRAALIGHRIPHPSRPARLAAADNVSLVMGAAASRPPAAVRDALAMPPRGAALRRNPLYCEQADGISVRRFPSPRYAEAVEHIATYPQHVAARARVTAGANPADDALIRRRVWVDLPPRW